MTEVLSFDLITLLAPAFCAGVVVALTHVPLGQEVLKRGIIFIDLAIAQIAALGVVIGDVLFHVEGGGAFSLLLALVFALAGSTLFGWLERKTPHLQEAFIGCAFVISASLIILVLAGDPHGGEEMQGLLAGQILWVGWTQVGLTALAYAVILFAWFKFKDKRSMVFYVLFPVVVTLSVQLVGVYLVFASLIIPAMGAAGYHEKNRLTAGYAIALAAVLSGLVVSVAADFPAGPTLVCGYAVVSFISFIFCNSGNRRCIGRTGR